VKRSPRARRPAAARQALGVDVHGELHVDVLVERGDAQRERGAEHHLGLRVEALRVEHRHLGPAEHPRHEAHQVEVALEGRAPGRSKAHA
jgi:hypothetical protein